MSGLKLQALDAEDLAVVSAHVQDAVMTVADLKWLPREKSFVLALNRFAWEAAGPARGQGERRRAALHFARVIRVASARIARDSADAVLNLLAIRFEAGTAPAGRIELDFAGGGSIRLEVECIEAQLTDLGGAWATRSRPAHAID